MPHYLNPLLSVIAILNENFTINWRLFMHNIEGSQFNHILNCNSTNTNYENWYSKVSSFFATLEVYFSKLASSYNGWSGTFMSKFFNSKIASETS